MEEVCILNVSLKYFYSAISGLELLAKRILVSGALHATIFEFAINNHTTIPCYFDRKNAPLFQ